MIIYLVARKVPEISDATGNQAMRPKILRKAASLVGSLPMEKLDFFTSQLAEKIVRKLRVYILELDNYLSKHLENFKRIKKFQGENRIKKYSLFENGDAQKNEEGVSENDEKNNIM